MTSSLPAKKVSGSYALATTLGLSTRDLSEYRYKSTRTTVAIYAIGEKYFAASKKAPSDQVGGMWREHPDKFWAEKSSARLWVCDAL